MDELQHLGGKQPPLPHLVALAQIALDEPAQILEGTGGTEATSLHGINHGPLALLNVVAQGGAGGLFGQLPAVDIHVHFPVIDLEYDKVGEAGHHRLRPLGEEELLQVVVAQRGVFDVDLPHHAHADLGLSLDGDVPESLDDPLEVLLHAGVGEALSPVHPRQEAVHAGVDGLIGLTGGDLVGADLVGGLDDDVPVHHGEHRLADEGDGELEAGVLLQAGQVHRDHRHELQPGLHQGLAEQVDIVGGPAAAAGLRDQQGHLMYVVLAALDGVDELPDHQQGGVAGVVVDIFLSGVHDALAPAVEHLHLEALGLQEPGQHGEVDGEHLGHQEGVLLLHLLGEEEAAGIVVDKLCHSNEISFPMWWRSGSASDRPGVDLRPGGAEARPAGCVQREDVALGGAVEGDDPPAEQLFLQERGEGGGDPPAPGGGEHVDADLPEPLPIPAGGGHPRQLSDGAQGGHGQLVGIERLEGQGALPAGIPPELFQRVPLEPDHGARRDGGGSGQVGGKKWMGIVQGPAPGAEGIVQLPEVAVVQAPLRRPGGQMCLGPGEEAGVDSEDGGAPADMAQEEGIPLPVAPPAGQVGPGIHLGAAPLPYGGGEPQVTGELPVDDGVELLLSQNSTS